MSIVPPSGDKTSATSGRRRSTTSRPSFPPAHAAAIPPLVTWARRGVEASDVRFDARAHLFGRRQHVRRVEQQQVDFPSQTLAQRAQQVAARQLHAFVRDAVVSQRRARRRERVRVDVRGVVGEGGSGGGGGVLDAVDLPVPAVPGDGVPGDDPRRRR
eukprot:16134-Pelagococcus_subviridis.AAC.4